MFTSRSLTCLWYNLSEKQFEKEMEAKEAILCRNNFEYKGAKLVVQPASGKKSTNSNPRHQEDRPRHRYDDRSKRPKRGDSRSESPKKDRTARRFAAFFVADC